MVKVDLKGLATVRAKGHTYHYAWRGGPRIETSAAPGTPAFMDAYNKAIDGVRAPDPKRFRHIIIDYKRKHFSSLAASTQRVWSPWLDRVTDYFGMLRTAQFDRPAKIRRIIRKWRRRYEASPRAADTGMQVLSRVCAEAVSMGEIDTNPCEGIEQLYKGDRSEIIWTDTDIAQLKAGSAKRPCPVEIAWAVDLAAHTGLRLGDVLRLSWSHVGEDAIVLTTGKSRHRREVIIPLYDGLRSVLATIPKRATTVLTSTLRRPWKANGFGTAFNRAKIAAKMNDRDLHFHDLRGTAATKIYIAGIEIRVIAEIMGWEEEDVAKIIRRYVGRSAATKALIDRLSRAKDGT